MLKVYVNKANESWIVDRIREEFCLLNPSIVTNRISKSNLIWIISPWTWQKLPKFQLKKKKVVCTIHHLEQKDLEGDNLEQFLKRDKFVNTYHVISRKTISILSAVTNKEIVYIPFWVNQNNFFEIIDKTSLRESFNLEKKDFIVGSFQRDSEGSDHTLPKLIKGPDRLLEIFLFLNQKYNDNLKVVLSGYRRNYLINELEKNKISYAYHGNTKIKELNELYNVLDLYIVSSRIEGGPQAVMECAITKTPIISTDVGVASEVLSPSSIFDMSNFQNARPDPNYAFKKVEKFQIPEHFKIFNKMFEELIS